ncbi:M20 family metallopeptidase [Streptomyces sp. NRRL F-5126]|uniref:M20 family metallopeptidase n=1 Tax=Streptomyces sp. NRRL F-5126 TaxID=1463857 RepID=UPI00068F66F2|nr:M20 family metallopeptidase [Streptomyces sp. NRRL F-5126]
MTGNAYGDGGAVRRLAAEARARTEELRGELLALSHAIHADPEPRFEEHAAAGRLRALLGAHGFTVEAGIGGLDTAFRATRDFGGEAGDGPTVAVFCEYDALPGLGHGCGHNVIAAAGAGAALAAAALMAERGSPGRLLVIGSPGEEGGGGKARLIDAGALDGVDAAVMAHAAGYDAVARTNLGRLSLEAVFTGRASHASAAPEGGRNALDAATLLLVAIGLLRQQTTPDSRIHARVAEGGQSINIIPERARVELFVRSLDSGYLRGRLLDAVRDCVRGAAIATGTSYTFDEVAPAYDPVLANPVLADLAAEAFGALGRPIPPGSGWAGPAGSTDMGNVSQLLPALHPYVCAVPGAALHTREFAAGAAGKEADAAVLDGGAMLAAVVTSLFTRPESLERAKAEFESATAGGGGRA